MIMDIALYSAVGFLVGFLIGLTGVGGGSIMTPILILVFSVPAAVAVGTDLLYATLTKSTGIFVHYARRTIDWNIVKLLSMGSIPATCCSVLLLKYLITTGIDYERFITIILSFALILTSLAIFYRGYINQSKNKQYLLFNPKFFNKMQKPLTIIFGVLIGILVTLSSVGAGALGAAVLFSLYPRLPTISIIGTDLAHAVPITAIAGIGHVYLGTVDYMLLGMLLLGSIPGIYLGSTLGYRLPEKFIRLLLASMLLIIGLRLVV